MTDEQRPCLNTDRMRHVAEILRRKCKIVVGSTDTHMVARGIEAMADALDDRHAQVQQLQAERTAWLQQVAAEHDTEPYHVAKHHQLQTAIEELETEVQRLRELLVITVESNPETICDLCATVINLDESMSCSECGRTCCCFCRGMVVGQDVWLCHDCFDEARARQAEESSTLTQRSQNYPLSNLPLQSHPSE